MDDATAVLITGGGTAGHTNPGIAIAQALVADGLRPTAVHFVGGQRGSEQKLVADAGFTIDVLPGRGLRRSLSPSAIIQNVGSIMALLSAVGSALRILRRHRPRVVVCLGGYAAFPTSTAAVLLRIPLVISEQNARASAVNRLFGRWAAANALPYPDTDLPNGVLTGNPIRPAVVDAVRSTDQRQARELLGISPDHTVIAVWAGSLGAARINNAVGELARLLVDRSDLTLYHVVGSREWPDQPAEPATAGGLEYERREYEDRMPLLQVAADVAICRAGASTTAELAVAGLPAILVPLPGAPRDHQRANARELVDAGGAIVIDDGELSGPRLASTLEPLLVDSDRRRAMGLAAASVGRPEAAVAVARLVTAIGGTP